MTNSADHGARDHATWSASATDRNWTCAGAIAFIGDTQDHESQAAAWGTACHQLSEKCFKTGKDADAFIGTIEKTKRHSIEVDEEVAETTQVYVDYVRERVAKYEAETGERPIVYHEQHFSLASLKPPFDAGGTGDTVIYFPRWKLIEVVDLKGGRGVVEAASNKQMRTYGLGAVIKNAGLDIERVKTTIVQPRAPHKDGRIRSEEFHIADLAEWTADLVAAMNRSAEAKREFGTMPLAAWTAKWLTPGKCKFCPKEGSCPALEQRALDAVGVWFDDLDKPQITSNSERDTPEKVAIDLDMLDMITDWVNARRAFAHQLAESGVKIPNYVLVPKQGREKWNDGVDDKVLQAVKKAGLAAEKYINPGKLKTPKQVRKALGKTHENLVAGLSTTPSEGTNLVRADKTTREAVQSSVDKFFNMESD